jgi:hypothetical protein
MNIREVRRAVRLTQLELSHHTGIERTRLSFAECGYVRLSEAEEAAIRRVVAKTVENVAEKVRGVLRDNGEHAARSEKRRQVSTSLRGC